MRDAFALSAVASSALVAVLTVPLGAGAASASAQAPACGADMRNANRLESARYAIAYRMLPERPDVSRHFAIEVAVCAKDGKTAVGGLRVDARMPEHGHGMNYAPHVIRRGDGLFLAEGLLFHMPGQWELVFDVTGSATPPERLTHMVAFP